MSASSNMFLSSSNSALSGKANTCFINHVSPAQGTPRDSVLFDFFSQISQALPATPFNVELWVENDDHFPRAQELCRDWLHPPPGATGTWTCAKCGQRLRDQFDSCWKCGAKRKTTAKLNKEGADD